MKIDLYIKMYTFFPVTLYSTVIQINEFSFQLNQFNFQFKGVAN